MTIISYIVRLLSQINLKIRLTVLIILVISSVMNSVIFWALNILQEDSVITDIQFCKDLGILFASNIIDLVDIHHRQELAILVEKIYLNTSRTRYILLFNVDGSVYFTLPIYSTRLNHLLHFYQNVFQCK